MRFKRDGDWRFGSRGFGGPRARGNKVRSPHRRTLTFEPLEDRRVLSLTVPVLNSHPGAPDTIFLDFDGAAAFNWQNRDASGTLNTKRVHGAGGNNVGINAFSLDGNVSDYTEGERAAIEAVWKYVSGKYGMFNVNVTTVDPGALVDGQSMRVLIGGSNADWYGPGGGVASIGSYNQSDEDNTCFDWSADAIDAGSTTISDNDLKFIGETATHEAGHVFGLFHQRAGDGVGNVTDEYYNGTATQVPIMGDSNQSVQFNKLAIWWTTNMESGQKSPDAVQDDLATLNTGGLAFASDDHGFVDTTHSLFVDGHTGRATQYGVINTVFDADAFKFVAKGPFVQFNASTYYDGSMLAPDLSLRAYPSFSTLSASVSRSTFSATLTATGLTPGVTYALVVTSRFGTNDIGGYSISGTTGSFAAVNQATGGVDVFGYADFNNNITMQIESGGALVLRNFAGGGVSEFRYAAFETPYIDFDLGNGNDLVTFEKIGPIPITFNGRGGSNTLRLNGTNNADGFTVIGNVATWVTPGTTGNIVTTVTFSNTGLELYGNGNGDYAILNNTWNQAISFSGGAGYNELYLVDTANAAGRDWEIHDTAVYHNYGGGQALIATYSGVNTMYVQGGDGNDNFLIGENHTLGNLGGMQLLFTGNGGYNTLTYDDSAGNHEDDGYTVTSGHVVHTIFDIGDYTLSDIFYSDINLYTINTRNDESAYTEFNVHATAAGSIMNIVGGAASEYLFLGDNFDGLADIQGAVYFYGGLSGSDGIVVDDHADTVGRTVHVDNYFVGGGVGDDLFAPGGLLYYTALAGPLTLKLGSGDDTAYVLPNPYTQLILEGNGPAGAGAAANDGGAGGGPGGDTVGFAFATAINPVFTPNGGGGSYTFDNAAPLSYTGFEGADVDDAAPYVLAQSYDDSLVPTIFVQFSEDVSNALNTGYLYVINNTTSEVLSGGVMALSYDVATNVASFTFPGYPGGVLPSGDYTAKIYGTLTDLFGNAIGMETPFDFQVIGPLLGDYNGDNTVDAADYTVWRDTLGQDGLAAFSGADGNGDGTIGQEDYDVWRSHFGESLPMGGGGGAAVAEMAVELAAEAGIAAVGQPSLQPIVVAIEEKIALPTAEMLSAFVAEPTRLHVPLRPAAVDVTQRDDALLAWIASRGAKRAQAGEVRTHAGNDSPFGGSVLLGGYASFGDHDAANLSTVDAAFALVGNAV